MPVTQHADQLLAHHIVIRTRLSLGVLHTATDGQQLAVPDDLGDLSECRCKILVMQARSVLDRKRGRQERRVGRVGETVCRLNPRIVSARCLS